MNDAFVKKGTFSCGSLTFQEEGTIAIGFHAFCTKQANASGSVKRIVCVIRSHHGNIYITPSSSKIAVLFYSR